MADQGRLISFEGIDGAGKSTQAQRLYRYLRDWEIHCALFREPGGTQFGEAVRELLLKGNNKDGDAIEFGEMAEALLFFSARAELMRQTIEPLLARGCIVLLDRFIDSTIAYQGYGRRMDIAALATLNSLVTHGRKPDLTFLVDLAPNKALARLNRSHDRIEAEGLGFLERVREGYLTLAEAEPERILVLDGEPSEEIIFEQLRMKIDKFLAS